MATEYTGNANYIASKLPMSGQARQGSYFYAKPHDLNPWDTHNKFLGQWVQPAPGQTSVVAPQGPPPCLSCAPQQYVGYPQKASCSVFTPHNQASAPQPMLYEPYGNQSLWRPPYQFPYQVPGYLMRKAVNVPWGRQIVSRPATLYPLQ